MKRKKNPQGTMVMFLETDLQKSLGFDESSLSPLQKQCFAKLCLKEQDKIRAGYGTVIADLESKKTICEFNMENYQPPQSAIESFARLLLPKIQEYYSNEENRRKFEEEIARKDKNK
jgi:hypothetical protein